MPSLAGRVILVTGADQGLGKQSVLEFARHGPAHIWLATDDAVRAEVAVADIRRRLPPSPSPASSVTMTILPCDLSSLESVKEAGAHVLEVSKRLDIVMLNAGVMAAAPGLTDQGYEVHIGTNFLGHALLLSILIPLLQQTTILPDADVRVVMVVAPSLQGGSGGRVPAAITEQEDFGIRFSTFTRPASGDITSYGLYCQSKLAVILWARKMAKVYPRFTTVAVHPGAERPQILSRLSSGGSGAGSGGLMSHALGRMFGYGTQSCDKSVRNLLWASVSDDAKSGTYYGPVGVPDTRSPSTRDDSLATDLWRWTGDELRPHLQEMNGSRFLQQAKFL